MSLNTGIHRWFSIAPRKWSSTFQNSTAEQKRQCYRGSLKSAPRCSSEDGAVFALPYPIHTCHPFSFSKAISFTLFASERYIWLLLQLKTSHSALRAHGYFDYDRISQDSTALQHFHLLRHEFSICIFHIYVSSHKGLLPCTARAPLVDTRSSSFPLASFPFFWQNFPVSFRRKDFA